MHVPDLSKESLLQYAAWLSLLLLAIRVLWPEFVHVVAMIWRSFVDGVNAIEAFRHRPKGSPGHPVERLKPPSVLVDSRQT